MLSQFESRTEQASAARVKMEEVIERNLSQTVAVIEQLKSTRIVDDLVKGSALEFSLDTAAVLDEMLDAAQERQEASRLRIVLPDGNSYRLHENAVGQISDKASLPLRFANHLLSKGPWGAELLAENFRRLYRNGNGSRYLIRTVGGETRGFLTDSYKRLDSSRLVDAFTAVCHEMNAYPVQGFALDTRIGIRAILPVVFEPVPGECLVFGINWQSSDFGRGANSISLFLMRLWCLNGATLDEVMRQVHFGRKLDDNIEFSAATIELDTLANISKMKDVVRSAFSEKNIETTLGAIKKANEENIDPKTALQMLKQKLNGSEVEMAIEAYNSPDIVNLPQGNTVYRLSNAVSWISQAARITTERRMELDRFAGELLGRVTSAGAVEV